MSKINLSFFQYVYFNLSIVVLLIFYPKKQKFEKLKQRKGNFSKIA